MASFTGTIPTPDDCFTLKVEYTPSWGTNYNTVKLSDVTGYVKRNKSTVYPYTTTATSTLTVNGKSTTKTGITYNLNDDNYDKITDSKSYTIYMTSDGTSSGTKVSSKSITVKLYFDGKRSSYYPIGSVTKTLTYTRKSFTVSFNANGGSGAPSSQTKYMGMDLTLSSTKPTRSGYTFLGWATSASATSATYKASGKYTANGGSNVTLYAVWSQSNTVQVINARFQNADGSWGDYEEVYSASVTSGTTVSWSYTADSEYKSASISYTATSSAATKYVDVYRQSYTITYNTNGGSGSIATQTFLYGSDLKLTKQCPIKTGYRFDGWCTTSTGGSEVYESGEPYDSDVSGNITLYAIYSHPTTSINLYATGECESSEFIEGSSFVGFGKQGETYATEFNEGSVTTGKFMIGKTTQATEFVEN